MTHMLVKNGMKAACMDCFVKGVFMYFTELQIQRVHQFKGSG